MALAVALPSCWGAAGSAAEEHHEVTVAALRDAPPFSYQGDDGTWRGLAVEMWNIVAADLQLDTHFVGMDEPGLLDAVASGGARFGIGPLSVTEEWLRRVDFSEPIYVTGVAIAVPHAARSAWGILSGVIFSTVFLKLAGGLIALLTVVGSIFWLFERRKNADFAGARIHGWGSGIWLSIVTMTTVGYGDKAPRTFGGRVVAALWMFVSIVLISIFTGTVATLLTIEHIGPRIRGFEDLEQARIATVSHSTAAEVLDDRRINAQRFPDLQPALEALLAGRADAVVFDRALLASALRDRPELPVTVLPGTLRLEYYAIAMRPGDPLRRQINAAIARTLDSPAWSRLRFDYLGSHGEHH